MTRNRDDMPDGDIHALVTGRLDAQQGFVLADFLASNPERAAEAMADLRMYEGLRMACGQLDAPLPDQMVSRATRLERRLRASRGMRRMRPFAAAMALFGLGWLGHAVWTEPSGPAMAAHVLPLAENALDARAAMDLHRALLPGQNRPLADPWSIAAGLGVALPPLPQDWVVRDAQVVATPERPALALLLDTPDMGEVMLLSMARESPGPDLRPNAFDYRGNSIAVFERDRSSYVLLDHSGLPAQVSLGADQFLRRFN